MNHYSTWKKYRVEDKVKEKSLLIKSSTQPPSNLNDMKYQDLVSLMAEKNLWDKTPSRKKKDIVETLRKFWE
ncbi:MAG: hypothetical protein ACOCQD_01545 [archaeon]